MSAAQDIGWPDEPGSYLTAPRVPKFSDYEDPFPTAPIRHIPMTPTEYELFRSRPTDTPAAGVSETEPAPSLQERPTKPPSAAEAEAAFRESQHPPMGSLAPGPRSLRSPDPLEPALAEIRGFRADILAGFEQQAKADRATKREVAKAAKANNANFEILKSAFGQFQREVESRFSVLEAKFAKLEERVEKQEVALEREREAVKRNREHVEKLRAELEKARAAAAKPAPP